MTAVQATEVPPEFEIQRQRVTLPVVVRDASSGVATFLVAASAVRRLLPRGLDAPEILPGRTLCSIAVIEYRDNDLGPYNEVSITFFVRLENAPAGIPYLGTAIDFFRGRVGTYIHWLPVTGAFTCEAGRTIWGFPKTLEDIALTRDSGRARCTLTAGGKLVLTLSLSASGTRAMPDTPMVTYSVIDGALHQTAFTQGGTGLGIALGGAELTLGDHPFAAELRALGLPKRPLMSMWMEKMHGRFAAALPVG